MKTGTDYQGLISRESLCLKVEKTLDLYMVVNTVINSPKELICLKEF